MQNTQRDLKELYEEQKSFQGKIKFEAKREFINRINSETGLRIPINEVGIISNIKTGEKQYFMMIHNERNMVK